MLAIGFLGTSLSCSRIPSSSPEMIKLSTLFSERHVIVSPYQSPGIAQEKEFTPVECVSLEKTEAGPNYLGLKKRLHIGPNYLSIIFAPPESGYAWELDLPPQSHLEFGIGIIRDQNFASLEEEYNLAPEGVEFLVEIEQKERHRAIFQKFLDMPPKEDFRTTSFSQHRVELPEGGGKFRLVLRTLGSEGVFSFWYNPIIVSSRKNTRGVILISLDTLRADHLGCYGYNRPTSPAIDSLASEGVIFREAISSSSWTLPAHVSLLTSTDAARHGVRAVDNQIPPAFITLPEILSQNGFSCAAITGGGFLSPIYGFARGFDFYNEAEGSLDYENSAELVARAAKKWLEDNKEKDFFLFLHTYQIHSPYAPPPAYRRVFLSPEAPFEVLNIEQYLGGKPGIFQPLSERERENARALYDAEIKYTDEALVDELIPWLKEEGLYDQLMIIITSDHGEEFYEHGAWGHGPHLYQESIRIPLIIKFPQGQWSKKEINHIVRLTDVAPTILEALGLKWPKDMWDGRSLIPILKGKENHNRVFLAESCWLSGELCGNGEQDPMPFSVATNQGKEKLVVNREWPFFLQQIYKPLPARWEKLELYDLAEDSQENKNLIQTRSARARQIWESLQNRYRFFQKMPGYKITLTGEQLERLKALGYIH